MAFAYVSLESSDFGEFLSAVLTNDCVHFVRFKIWNKLEGTLDNERKVIKFFLKINTNFLVIDALYSSIASEIFRKLDSDIQTSNKNTADRIARSVTQTFRSYFFS